MLPFQAYLFDHLGGYQSVAEHFGVTNRSQVQHWVKLYENNPQLLYQDNRGRPAQLKSETMTLEEQVNYLKMEVAILKKLRKLL